MEVACQFTTSSRVSESLHVGEILSVFGCCVLLSFIFTTLILCTCNGPLRVFPSPVPSGRIEKIFIAAILQARTVVREKLAKKTSKRGLCSDWWENYCGAFQENLPDSCHPLRRPFHHRRVRSFVCVCVPLRSVTVAQSTPS